MNFLIGDRDLLVIEPSVFVGAASAATVLLSVADAEVAGTSLTSATAEFEANDIDEGHVGVVDGMPVEVLSRVQDTQLSISLPRASTEDSAIPPGDGTNLSFSVLTFKRLIQRMQHELLQRLGLHAEDPEHPLDETAILNPEAVGRALALQTIAQAFAEAAAVNPSDESLAARAAVYTRVAERAFLRTPVTVDLDGDGIADATRRVDVVAMRRC